jgi:hypothetical protein
MTIDERDLRMVVVAFEDAVAWCETLADMTEELIESARTGQGPDRRALDDAAAKIAETRRLLLADRSDVQRIKSRAGLP